ncbi:MAG: prephenate dehydratase [Gammaproteobacteria bacterium SG8_47]|nr:MAG: prephenate dehydratase [Gammaproteobacteria bacterium SG8_47]
MSDELKALRGRIDEIDAQIEELISERAGCAQRIASAKLAEDSDAEFYRAEREAKVLREVKARNRGPLSDEEMARLFREIMSACLALEQRMTVAFLGPEGTFTQAAALKHFGHSVKTLPLATIDEVFREVESSGAHYGVVPVENSTEGMITHTLDCFIRSPLKICGEVELRIHHHLLAKGLELSGIKRVYSHRQSLAQCRKWLDANLPGVAQIDVSSNAEAARKAAHDSEAAAIAGSAAADIYGLDVVMPNIEDEPDNTTRFLIIGRRAIAASGKDKTSLVLATPNKPGALHRLLEPLARNGISMTRIESRPSRRGMWDYVFFIDLEGHKDEANVARALHELEADAMFFKLLGSYPKAEL